MPFSTKGQSSDADLRALALEREVYGASSPQAHNQALLAKCRIRKEQGLYREALGELSRIYTYALGEDSDTYYYERALCGYLAGEFDQTLATIDEARFYIPTTSATLHELNLIEALAAAQKGEWERSEGAAKRFVEGEESLTPEARSATLCELEELYDERPRLRNPMVAWWLSLAPGVGQFYAGEWLSGTVSLLVNGALAGFAVSEFMAGQWLSGWVVGCGGLSTTYFVGQERARILTLERNQRLLDEYNSRLRTTLLGK